VRLVDGAQRSKAPMSRLADRFAIVFLAITVLIAVVAWFFTRDVIRSDTIVAKIASFLQLDLGQFSFCRSGSLELQATKQAEEHSTRHWGIYHDSSDAG
jgi:hypothetical protein